ncbi:hypothetical protein OAM99_04805 [Planktomarina sp.]|nr:hypothetical protein [Planktomarina sp.]
MEIISHRINTIAQLKATNPNYGVEVDIRSDRQNLIVHHDPFSNGELFNTWLESYQHGTLILNVKEEALESYLIDLMSEREITNYFFLDQTFPFLIKWSAASKQRCAVRVSEFESIDTAMALKGMARWIWVDCFTKFPLNKCDTDDLKKAGFKLCLVSPELQGRDPDIEISALVKMLTKNEIDFDAVCTKRPDLWERWYR